MLRGAMETGKDVAGGSDGGNDGRKEEMDGDEVDAVEEALGQALRLKYADHCS